VTGVTLLDRSYAARRVDIPAAPVSVLEVLDLLGVFVFALSGATLALEKRLDLFGVCVLAVVTALGGGLLRDVLLGALPPAALDGSRYLLVALAAGGLAFVAAHQVARVAGAVRLFDAAGLGLFVATGTAKALGTGLGGTAAVVLGCLTGIGGGMARDVLVGEVPVVLRRELYAVPAVLGASVVVLGDGLGLAGAPTAALAAGVVFAVRMTGVWRDWHFPVARR
jgi:uncharacterized membrane protein YeiH